MNTYKTSTGERITKEKIDKLVRLAKSKKLENQLNEHGYNFCEQCANEGLPGSASELEIRTLDCAHILSVDRCQKMGKSELAWDVSNIRILCRAHHREHDGLNLKFK